MTLCRAPSTQGALFGVGTEENWSDFETSGPSHGRVQEAKVPQRHPASIEIHYGLPEVPRIPEESSYRHVATRTSRREPRSHYEAHAASGPDEVPQRFVAFDDAPFVASYNGLNREDVLKQPTILVGTNSDPVFG
jgi:hypothetical protein